ncbi:MAG: hypothetical protein ABL919_13100 [Methylococcales bacterium]|nr:hypothetical protein [Methylococcaceae bacterium]
MKQHKKMGRWLTGQESDSFIVKVLRIIGIALVVFLGMLIASGILFNAIVVQFTGP